MPLETIGQGLVDLVDSGALFDQHPRRLQRTCIGLLLGVSLGIVVAGMALSPVVERVLGPLYHIMRQVPILGLIPLIALWFGSGEGAKVLIVSLAAFTR